MLNSLRSLASSFVAKMLLVLLVLSFGVWGIGDMLRSPSHTLSVATVGSAKITRDSFARALHQKSEAIRQMMGDRYSPEMMKSINVPQQVLLQMVNQTLLKQESESLGLVPSDADVVKKIRSNPSFQDEKGNFDKGIFDTVLRNSGMSEKNFVEQMREDMAANTLRETFTVPVSVPDSAVTTLLAIRDEQRKITFYTLSSAQLGEMPEPTVAQAKAYYDGHAREFMAPEYRTVNYITISPADVKDTAASEDSLHAAYKERMEEFKRPERRNIEQLLYDSKENAEKAGALLASGKTVAQVAKSTPILNKDAVSMGNIERSKLFEGAADKVFSLKQNEFTDPLQSPFGWHIFHVIATLPPTTASFEEARPVLEKEMKQRGAEESLNTLVTKVEDALAGGNTLAEVSRDFSLKVQAAGPFDKQGNAPDGSKAKALPDFDKFIDTAFKVDEKSDSQPLPAKGGAYYILHVDKIVPEHLRALDEVRSLVTAGCQREERDKRLHDMAKNISTEFLTPADRPGIIARYKLDAAPATIRRDSEKAGNIPLLPQLVMDVFAHKAQENTPSYPLPNGSYVLAVVDAVVPVASSDNDPKLKAAMADIHSHLEENFQHEILDQYMHYLATKYAVSVNQAVLQSVTQ